MIFVDTNILIDIASANPSWGYWSATQLAAARSRGPCVINAVVFAEFAFTFTSLKECQAEISRFQLTLEPIDEAAAFLAASAFKQYRQAGGARTGVLPDYLIGAHAATLNIPLLTRDSKRYRTYFPGLALIAPTND